MAGIAAPLITVTVDQHPANDEFANNTYKIKGAIPTGSAYPSDSDSIEVKIINGNGKGVADDVRHLLEPKLTLSFQVMDSSGGSVDTSKPIPAGWAEWFLCAFNDDPNLTAKFNTGSDLSSGTSGAVPIKADSQSGIDANSDQACIYGTVNKTDGSPVNDDKDKYCTMKFRIKPQSSTGAGNYQYILKIAGIYT